MSSDRRSFEKIIDQPSAGPSRLARKRFFNKVWRANTLTAADKSRFPIDTDVLLHKFQENPLLDGLVDNRKRIWLGVNERQRKKIEESINLESFSFLDNPSETLHRIHEICIAECEAVDARINFRDRHCLDLGPYLVLSEIVKRGMPIFMGGSVGPSIAKVIDAVGLRKDFSMAPLQLPDGHAGVWAFPMRQRRPAGSSRSPTRHLDPQRSERVAGDLIDEIDNWLGVVSDVELAPGGRRIVTKIVGEVLDNAERFSDSSQGDGDWKIAGFMARRGQEEAPLFRCHLAFLSVGSTIAESFNGAHPEVKRRLSEYLKLIGVMGDPLKRELHTTMFAIQDGITSDAAAFSGGRGGTGLLEILDLFCGLSGAASGAPDAQLGILSGRGYLRFFPPYVRGLPSSGSGGRQLWLNASNNAQEAPSPDHAIMLSHELRGTLVTMAFNIDPKYLGTNQ